MDICGLLIGLSIGYIFGTIAYVLIMLRWGDAIDRWLDRIADRENSHD